MFKPSTIQLLRFPFSFFLLPVFLLPLVFVQHINWLNTALLFVVLHFLIYPSSNGYNSYMDRDEASIGGIKKPMQPTKELLHITYAMDMLAIILTSFISFLCLTLVCLYITCSRLYSFRGIRLKKFPIIGYLTVIINQGAIVFFMVYHGASVDLPNNPSLLLMAASSLLIGGFYPITQIYQHQQDKADSVTTISMLLGIPGTFVYCAIIYTVSFGLLFYYLQSHQQINYFIILNIFFIPVLFYFFKWAIQCWKDKTKADFEHTMRMNWIASVCTNLAFITLIIMQQIG